MGRPVGGYSKEGADTNQDETTANGKKSFQRDLSMGRASRNGGEVGEKPYSQVESTGGGGGYKSGGSEDSAETGIRNEDELAIERGSGAGGRDRRG